MGQPIVELSLVIIYVKDALVELLVLLDCVVSLCKLGNHPSSQVTEFVNSVIHGVIGDDLVAIIGRQVIAGIIDFQGARDALKYD